MLGTLPNLLTLSRILLIPILIATFFIAAPWANWAAVALFSTAAITDYFDGHFARARKQQSRLGAFLDPVADKLLVAATLLMLVAVDRVTGLTTVAAVIILCREILVSGLREFLAALRVGLPVTHLAKWKTAIQMVALAVLLVGDAAPAEWRAAEIGIAGLWAAAVLTVVTGYSYLRIGLRHMMEDEDPPALDGEATDTVPPLDAPPLSGGGNGT
jgi:cardiolipin synthase